MQGGEMDDNQGGGVGAFQEEEANKKRQKKEDSVSNYSLLTTGLAPFELDKLVQTNINRLHRETKLTRQFTRPSGT